MSILQVSIFWASLRTCSLDHGALFLGEGGRSCRTVLCRLELELGLDAGCPQELG
jgi:hypothetical protein